MLVCKHRAAIFPPAIAAAVFGCRAGTAVAAPPQIESVGIAEGSVTATGATLIGSVNANGENTTYRFEYLTEAAYEGNLEAGRDGFGGSQLARTSGAGPVGAGTSPESMRLPIAGLNAATSYRYRLRAANTAGESALSAARPFATAAPTNAFELLDHRDWEMVSPIDKGGGAVHAPGAISGGGVSQGAAAGGAITYSSADSFDPGAQGAPSGSQYLTGRNEGGWVTTMVSTPLLVDCYASGNAAGDCPVANTPLPGTEAHARYRDYCRRNAAGSFESEFTPADRSDTPLGSSQSELMLVAATPDLTRIHAGADTRAMASRISIFAPTTIGGVDAALHVPPASMAAPPLRAATVAAPEAKGNVRCMKPAGHKRHKHHEPRRGKSSSWKHGKKR